MYVRPSFSTFYALWLRFQLYSVVYKRLFAWFRRLFIKLNFSLTFRDDEDKSIGGCYNVSCNLEMRNFSSAKVVPWEIPASANIAQDDVNDLSKVEVDAANKR